MRRNRVSGTRGRIGGVEGGGAGGERRGREGEGMVVVVGTGGRGLLTPL